MRVGDKEGKERGGEHLHAENYSHLFLTIKNKKELHLSAIFTSSSCCCC
jgi:hypothetical protein